MRTPALLAAGTALWEADAMRAWAHPRSSVALVKRCMDLSDLLATATTGVARLAVLDEHVFGLDKDAFRTLRELGLLTAVVAARDPQRWLALGADHVWAPHEVVDRAGSLDTGASASALDIADSAGAVTTAAQAGRLVAVWGPAGAPGRTSVALSIAGLLDNAVLIDADPYGGVLGQRLGVLDPVSGLLAASRLVNTARLDVMPLTQALVRVDALRVLTGLPRADRWNEVRGLDEILGRARDLAPWVVVDTGFSLEHDVDAFPGTSQRNDLTWQALEAADDVMVVGAPDAIGLSRLVRALAELADSGLAATPMVVVNGMRSGLGWSERDVLGAIGQVAPDSDVFFLPHDLGGADKALLSAQPMSRAAGSAYRKSVARVTQALSRRYSPVTV